MQSTDPRLAALYDLDNPSGADHEFFCQLARELNPRLILDLGCGTGLLTAQLVAPGRLVIGIDPDSGMLDIAKQRQEKVEWVLGDSQLIGSSEADLVLMTGNVAQHIGQGDWERTLQDIHSGLAPGGILSFESRNPDVQAWRNWTKENSLSTRNTPFGELTEWIECTEPDETGTVMLTAYNRWEETGEELIVKQPLTFRSYEKITQDLADAGFEVEECFGGWHREKFTPESPIMVFVAKKVPRTQ
ncbi:MAG: class I SAM-dependent methyltransferase [Armatimonadetes bacterium]|nr:class I SAM-dependent methyltransferase [Armatimonadota bacterium]